MNRKPTPDKPADMGWESRSKADPANPPAPGEAFHAALAQLAELREYVAYFVSAKVDGLKAGIRSAVLYAILGVLGAMAGATVVVVSATLLLVGVAHALGAAMGGRDWLGDLIVGAVVLIAIMVGAILGLKILTSSSRKRTVEKYESRQHQQRRTFAHDVAQRAHEGGEGERGASGR